jgi:hypothetical protein
MGRCYKVSGRRPYSFVPVTVYVCTKLPISRSGGDPMFLLDGGNAIEYPWGDIYSMVAVSQSNCLDCDDVPPPLTPEQPHDCVNGACLPLSVYGTPGKFTNRAACESACAKDSTCTGECIELPEITALQQAANQLKARYCK